MSTLKNIISKIYSKKYLLVTNTVTGTLFLGSGDVIEQQLVERRLLSTHQLETQFDSKRTVGMCCAGTYFGLIGHFWYLYLDRRFPSSVRLSIPKKLLCEAIVGPPFGASIFFIVGALEKKGWHQIWTDLKSNIVVLCAMDWLFYIPLQSINFYYLNPRFRFLFVALISLIYDTFLSYILHK